MKCDNCSADGIAYTLTTYVEDEADERIDLHFCSTDCLREWTRPSFEPKSEEESAIDPARSAT